LVIHGGGKAVVMHLGMTGQFRIAPVPREYRRHHFLSLIWDTTECCFIDFRRFARVKAEPPNNSAALGGYLPGRGLVLRAPTEIARCLPMLPGYQSTSRIAWLLRHGHRTGVGNYLANEALGRLCLSPFEPCRDARESVRILRKCQQLAKQSYSVGGTSFGIGYFRLDGSVGRFSEQLSFYKNPGTTRTLYQNRGVYSDFSPPKRSES
jgi:formamidopyrimidine-DNA glycosylase